MDSLLLRTRTGTRLSEQTGSIQQFVESRGDASEYRFDGSEFSLRDSERIALQDLRLFNCDRHEGNVLVCSPKHALAEPRLAEPAQQRHGHTPSAGGGGGGGGEGGEGGEGGVRGALEEGTETLEGPKLELVPIEHALI